jgi:hypothetical protein
MSSSAFAAKTSSSESDVTDRSSKIGVGFGYLKGRVNNVPTLSGDIWISDKAALELMFGMTSGSLLLGGTGTDGKPVNDTASFFGASFGSRQVLAQHGIGLLFEAVERLGYVNESSGLTILGKTNTSTIGTINVFGGFGIEATFPFWQNVTLEINTGLNYLAASTTTTGGSSSESIFFLGGSAYGLPFNFAVHYYF